MSLQEAEEGEGAGVGSARNNEAEIWSTEMTKGQQCVLKT